MQIPSELFSDVEVPISKNDLWRLGFWQRYDLGANAVRDYGITGIYQEDCIAYGLNYDRAMQSISVSVILTAFGNLHHALPGMGFTQ